MGLSLLYGYDALCGWCYGYIPALKALEAARPDLPIEVLPGGLFLADRAVPYGQMVGYIRQASARMTAVTGQPLSEAMFAMMETDPSPLCHSTPPNHAVMQMKALAPDRVLDFAHAVQVAHFVGGKDLNDPQTYDAICAELDLPQIEGAAMATARDDTPLVAEAYARSAGFGINSYPTLLVMEGDRPIRQIASLYEPEALIQAVAEAT